MIRYTRLKGLRRWPLAVLFVLLPAALHAQSITDPRRVEFTPSPDHNAVDGSGNPIVQSYSLQIYLSGGSTPVVPPVPLGKPALDTDGMIRVDFVSLLPTPLTPGVMYEGRVTAIGPGGSATSLPSNTFSFTAPCAPTISPTSQSVAAGGGSASTTVTAGAGCGWTATSNNTGWITVSTGSSGSGSGTVTVSVGANSSSSSRSGTVTVAGSTFTINQAGLTCNDTISPSSKAFAVGGESVDVSVTAPDGCSWTISNGAAWITVTPLSSGPGNGTVRLTAAANTGTSSRSANLTIAGRTFNATQTGISCNDTISPGSKAFATGGEAINVTVTAPSGCSWTASSPASWLTVTAPANPSGNGTVTLSAAANTAGTPRSTTVTIAGNSFNASQAGVPCTDTISPGSKAFDVDGESINVSVTAPTGCTWTAPSSNSWITVTVLSGGPGNGTVKLTADPNNSITPRNATLTIAGNPFNATQVGAACNDTIDHASQTFSSDGGNGTVTVTAPTGCTWAASTGVSWISVSAGGSGNGTVTLSVDPYTGTTTRTGNATIAGNTFTVTQTGVSCGYSISAPSGSVGAGGGTGNVDVTTSAGCGWTATSNSTWIDVTSGSPGNGPGTVGFRADPNTGTSARSGTISIAGKTFTVNEAGAPCVVTLDSSSHSFNASGGTDTIAVSAPAGCSWSATKSGSWITITSAGPGSGNGSVGYSVSANTGTSSRNGSLTIGGNTFNVTEAGTACSFSIGSTSQSVAAGGGSGSVTVTAPSGCGWNASSSVGWVTINNGSGSGNGSATFTIAGNPNTSTRSTTLTIAGKPFTVNQAAAACTFVVTPASLNPPLSGGSGSFTITAPAGCSWSTSSSVNWIAIAGSGNGSGTASYFITGWGGDTARTTTIMVAGKSIPVTQAPPPPAAPQGLRIMDKKGKGE